MASLFTKAIEVAPLRAQLLATLHLPVHPDELLRVGHAPVTAATSPRAMSDIFEDLSSPTTAQ